MNSVIRHLSNKGSYIIGLAIASLIGGLVSAVALAAIPDNNGVIHACYKNVEGTLRVVDPSSGGGCKNSETPLSWSVGSSSTTISNRIVLLPGDLTTEPLLNMPDLGQLVIEGCDANGRGSMVYVNNTNHDIQFDRYAVIAPGQDSTIIDPPQAGIPIPVTLAYTDSNGKNYVATLNAPFLNVGFTSPSCQFTAQATISQN